MFGIVFCVMATLGMVSCTPEEKEEFSLVGKTYAATKYFGSGGTVYDGYTAYYVIRFTSSNTIECSDRKNGIHGELLGYGKIGNGAVHHLHAHLHRQFGRFRLMIGIAPNFIQGRFLIKIGRQL